MAAEYEYREFHLFIDGGVGPKMPVRCVGTFCPEDGSVQIDEVWTRGGPGLEYNIFENLKHAVVAHLATEAEDQRVWDKV